MTAAVPTIRRRLACVLYESLLLLAVLFVSAFPFVALIQGIEPTYFKAMFQLYLVFVAGIYFSVFWRRGQTLAMKTWGIRIELVQGGMPGIGRIWVRYLLSCLNLALLGIGWWGALFSPDRQFLQDRLAGTRLIRA